MRDRRLHTNAALGILLASTLIAGPSFAETLRIEAVGTVATNDIVGAEPLSLVEPGETVTLTLEVDSDVWESYFPDLARGYEIASFDLSFSGGVQIGLLSGAPPSYFGVADDLYFEEDAFWVAENSIQPGRVPLAQEPYLFDLQLSYEGDTLTSTEILEALGSYDASSAQVVGFRVWDSYGPLPEVLMDVEFEQLTIALVTGDSIHADGFASGDASGWSAVVP